MLYYFYSLILCLIISFCLFLLIIYRIKVNNTYKNRHAISFLLPVLLSFVFIFFCIKLTIPRIMDLVYVATGRFEVEEIEFAQNDIEKNIVRIDDADFYYNPFALMPETNILYRIEYTPRSRFVISLEPVTTEPNDIVSN